MAESTRQAAPSPTPPAAGAGHAPWIPAAGTAALAVVAFLTFFSPWHRASSVGLEAAFCWVPDCHPSSSMSARECTGFDHAGTLGLLLVLATVIVQAAVLFLVERRVRRGVAVAGMTLAVAALGWNLLSDPVAHLFDNVETYLTGSIHAGTLLAVALLDVALLALDRDRRTPAGTAPAPAPGPGDPAPPPSPPAA